MQASAQAPKATPSALTPPATRSAKGIAPRAPLHSQRLCSTTKAPMLKIKANATISLIEPTNS